MTIADLIQAYWSADTPRRKEDERHAAWWSDRIGQFSVEELRGIVISPDRKYLAVGYTDEIQIYRNT